MAKVVLLLATALVGLGLATRAQAQRCGPPCQRCAAKLGIPVGPDGPAQSMARGRGWQICLEQERAAEGQQQRKPPARR